jgi:transposase
MDDFAGHLVRAYHGVIMDDPNTSQLVQLQRENERLRASLHQSNTQLAEVSSKVESLHGALQERSSRITFLETLQNELTEHLEQRDRKIDDLQHRLQELLRRHYGRSSEKLDPNQRLLFEDVIDKAIPEMPADDDGEDEAVVTKRKGHGRRKLPADLKREKVIHDLPDDEKPCPCCGKMRHVIGKQTHELLDYVPAKVKVIEHIRLTYGCPDCERNASPDGPQIVTAEKPLQPIEKGLAAPGLLSYVIVSKYGDHLPMHRLEGILRRYGIEIARSTMCDWGAQCADVLRPLYDLMVNEVRASKVIHTDDTPVKVQDRSRTSTRTGRYRVYLGDDDHPQTVFAYTPSRSRDGPMAFLRDWGKDERVYLQADAFGGYDGIYAGEAGGQVTEVACWSHARRKFYDARHSAPDTSTQALAQVRLLYDVEKKAKKAAEKKQADLMSERYRLRQELTVPRLVEFRTWLESQRAENGGSVLPKSPMGQAMQYALNQWDALCVYTTDGRLAIDNNASENALRRVAVGRKNWLFAGSDNGGRTAATLFSLIATCQRHQVEPMAYLRDVLARIAALPVSRLATLLPGRWKPAPTN